MLRIINNPDKEDWTNYLKRNQVAEDDLKSITGKIFSAVALEGDKAVQQFNEQFGGAALENLTVTEAEMNQAENVLSTDLKEAINIAAQNIERFHQTQKEPVNKTETMPGVTCWRETRAIESVGLYIPGGSAPLFSTVLMLGIPAKIAGCANVLMCTPANQEGSVHPAILYAAKIAGIKKIFKIGGIQAIAAMTVGTQTVQKVQKLFGPGNQYVTAAKQYAQGLGTAIDMPAGPSEVLVIADNSCNPEFVAADLLSQAEHGTDSQVILLSDDIEILNKVNVALEQQLGILPRKELAAEALKNSYAILFNSLDVCMEYSNRCAPEHLILVTVKNDKLINLIQNAGSVFLGNYSCESAGDYASGTNHTLPTNGYAKCYSGVSLDSFIKKITFQELTAQGIKNIGGAVATMAAAEGLQAHKNAITVRLNNLKSS